MGFKEEVKFARFLTYGVRGTLAVSEHLKRHGHSIVELERYAAGNKIWGVRPKRLRMPDLLCLRCGRRFESKGKSKLELKLSHGGEGREWFSGGMRDDDVFAFVWIGGEREDDPIGRPFYVTRGVLEAQIDQVKAGTRKAIADGSEADISWPSWVPSYGGRVVAIEGNVITVERAEGGQRTYPARWTPALHRQVGEEFEGGRDIVASVVPPADVLCAGEKWALGTDLWSDDVDDRYAAIKAARFLGPEDVEDELIAIADDTGEDWRVRLEATAALAQSGSGEWTRRIRDVAAGAQAPLDRQMEAVFVLSELGTETAVEALVDVAGAADGRHEEVRAAAVWGLGVGRLPSPVAVALFLDDQVDRVALHAAASLPDELTEPLMELLVGWLRRGNPRQAALAAHVLARHAELPTLVEIVGDREAAGRLNALNALGSLPRAQVEPWVEPLSADDRQALEALWVAEDDWLVTEENEGALDILGAQRLRRTGLL